MLCYRRGKGESKRKREREKGITLGRQRGRREACLGVVDRGGRWFLSVSESLGQGPLVGIGGE